MVLEESLNLLERNALIYKLQDKKMLKIVSYLNN